MAAGFFFVTRFLLAAFFFADFFLATFFLLTFLFLAAGFFRETFFRPAAFLADFFLATTFFLDELFADDFFLLTLRFLPAGFFRLTDLAGAAFFLVARALFRFLLAVFLAVTLQFLPDRKARNYTPVVQTWKGICAGFDGIWLSDTGRSGTAGDTVSGVSHRHHLLIGSRRQVHSWVVFGA